jgi:hypothetical protein
MNENFAHIVDSPSIIVDSIVDNLMFHTHKNDAKRFLYCMDNYISYYLYREHEGLCFPTLLIPSCPEWAKEVFIKYLIIRLAVYYNSDTIEPLLRNTVTQLLYVDPYDSQHAREARKRNKYLTSLRQYKQRLKGFKTVSKYIGESRHKNLLFCSPLDIAVSKDDRNEFINEFYGEIDDIFTQKNLCVCHNLTTKAIRLKIAERKENVSIDNIFVLYKNNDECNSLRKTNIERLNRICNTGVKNCFVFEFSDHPYCLNSALRWDKKFSYIYQELDEKTFQDNMFFTVFSNEESRYVFFKDKDVTGDSDHIHAIADTESHEVLFSGLIGTYTDNAEYWLQERNIFSLCLSDELIRAYCIRIQKDISADECALFDESFAYQKLMAESIRTKILDHLRSHNTETVAIVVDYYFPNHLRILIKNLFPDISVKIYNYSALKPVRIERNLCNNIREKDVFVLRYRPHNARTPYAFYPNSFDPFVINPGQHIIEIIQDFIFIDKYLWDKYDYKLDEYKFFNSVYEKEVLGGREKPIKPKVSRVSGNDEPGEDGITGRQSVKSLEVIFDNGRSARIPETEWMICKTINDDIDIVRLKTLKDNNSLDQITAVQRLDEIISVLSNAIIEKEKEASRIERVIRQSYCDQGLITTDERDSDIYLWKLLLSKKAKGRTLRELYDEFMAVLQESERVQIGAFEKWVDTTNKMILPLQKSTQRKLFEYLGLSPSYLMAMRSKKMSEINNTRNNNSMLENFLVEYLLCDIDEDAFDHFKESKINEILQYQKIDDLKTLIEILNEYINLKKINSL